MLLWCHQYSVKKSADNYTSKTLLLPLLRVYSKASKITLILFVFLPPPLTRFWRMLSLAISLKPSETKTVVKNWVNFCCSLSQMKLSFHELRILCAGTETSVVLDSYLFSKQVKKRDEHLKASAQPGFFFSVCNYLFQQATKNKRLFSLRKQLWYPTRRTQCSRMCHKLTRKAMETHESTRKEKLIRLSRDIISLCRRVI